MLSRKLPRSFYLQDALPAARALLGQTLVTRIGGCLTAGVITETEAYAGIGDRASHAYNGRRTRRTEVMYTRGGVAYVYLCYGIHSLFNVVVGEGGDPQAVLIRAVRPVRGLAHMLRRRHAAKASPRLTAGPGTTAQALGIGCRDSGVDLLGDRIWIAPAQAAADPDVQATTRIGVEYAGSDARLPYRFVLKN